MDSDSRKPAAWRPSWLDEPGDFYEKIARDAMKRRGEPITPSSLTAEIERITVSDPPLDANLLADLASDTNGPAVLGMIRESRRRDALLKPFPGAGDSSPESLRKYAVSFPDGECIAVEEALCVLLEHCRDTGELVHVPHAQAMLRRMHDSVSLLSYYDPGSDTIFIRA